MTLGEYPAITLDAARAGEHVSGPRAASVLRQLITWGIDEDKITRESNPAANMVIPAASYKSDHVHVMPLVPQALEILRWVLAHHPQSGPLSILGNRRGEAHLWMVEVHARLRNAIYATTGGFLKPWTPHDIRRTVATRVAEATGELGDKLVKRVLGHAEQSVTAIYNRYAYVKEVRRVLADWATELLATEKMTYCCAAGKAMSDRLIGPASLAA